jgi:H+-translocating NAD(P) transhydrogenase subunit alpha
MVIGLLKEKDGESRVSVLPEAVVALKKLKAKVWFESNAGGGSFEADPNYVKAEAELKTRDEILAKADIILSIHLLASSEVSKIKPGAVIVGVFQPLANFAQFISLAEKGLTVFSLDMLPRTTRAQAMDVLSSQASVAGYKAVLVAAQYYPRYFPMLMTSAGTVTPAKVLILGAGVAGLQAIATAKRLGAVVEVFDTRPAAKEEVLSLGAKFIEVEGAADASKAGGYAVEQTEEYKQKQQLKINEAVAKADVVITTAQIPGKRAPLLLKTSMVDGMRAGSVIVDLAASSGGNCELTKNNEVVIYKGISIIGNSNLPGLVPADASKLYGKNIVNFLRLIINDEGNLNLNFEDELVIGACITHNKEVVNDRVKGMAAHN